MSRLAGHLGVLFGFAVLAIGWTFPLVSQLETHMPGSGVGDNAMFLWNFWWMRTSLGQGSGFFQTPYLFAPIGVDLTLHTHTALPAFVGATLLGSLSAVAALNVTTLGSLTLNGFCAYLLAWKTTKKRAASVLAGVIFATSPYIAAHLNGHFNLTAAWTIPLFALCLLSRGVVAFILGGAVLALTAYIDYYYLVYEFAIAAIFIVVTSRDWSVKLRSRAPSKKILAALLVVIAADIVAIVYLTVGRAKLPFNLAQLLSVLVAFALWVRFRPAISARARDNWTLRSTVLGLSSMLGVFLVGIAPLVWHAARLFAEGQYVSQQYQWRNSPIGIDLLTMLIGNPFHGILGRPIAGVYSSFGIDLIESGAWLGVVPILLAVMVLRNRTIDRTRQFWKVIGVTFFVWALGSHIHLAGYNTGLIAPQVLLRFVPIAANARMPGRAMVVVYLALGILAALAVSSTKWKRPAVMSTIAGILVLADYWVAPVPTVPVECPPIYAALRDRPESGAVAELPLGIGDGFGAITPVDNRILVCQTVHGRPIVGGVIARLPPKVMDGYRADPLLSAWLRLSGAQPSVVKAARLPDRSTSADRLAAARISFVMLNRHRASQELRDFVERTLPLTLLAEDAERALYFVQEPRRIK